MSDERILDVLMEHCLEERLYDTMQKILVKCDGTYSKHDYYVAMMVEAKSKHEQDAVGYLDN